MPEFKFDANTILAILYLQYKTNQITRKHLKDMLGEVKKKWPEDVAKYLVEESIQ
jgi:hypothetical protein